MEYEVVLEDRTTMSDKSFYIPGLDKVDKQQWNRTTPAFRILARKDLYPLRDCLNVGHMQKPLWSLSFHEENEIKRRAAVAIPIMPMAGFPFVAY